MVTLTSMLPRVALEYGQTWWAASAISWRRSGATLGRKTSSSTARPTPPWPLSPMETLAETPASFVSTPAF